MYITTNHVALLVRAKDIGGLTVGQAKLVNQHTLGSACSKTKQRPRLLDFNAHTKRFEPTKFGLLVLDHPIKRQSRDKRDLSQGVKRVTRNLLIMSRVA